MLTIVTLNYARPRYLLENVRAYARYRLVDRIICFNNGAPLDPAQAPAKCLLVQSSQNLGVYPRYSMGALASTHAILHTDDDILLPEDTLQTLFTCWRSAPDSCHGLHGRIVRPTYQLGDVFGQVEVVLTRALLCSRLVNNAALAATIHFDDLKGVPRGNGEDIILSFAGMATSRQLNFAYPLRAKDHPVERGASIHSWPGHLEHRRAVVDRCRQVFRLP
ncbi:MAG TPA: hypothetical protein VGG92_00185 [Caulobacteraceae bacterium]|jgi:hypothetical protein